MFEKLELKNSDTVMEHERRLAAVDSRESFLKYLEYRNGLLASDEVSDSDKFLIRDAGDEVHILSLYFGVKD